MKGYILGEYGSWGVAILSYLAGLSAAEHLRPGAIAVFAALVLYVNSKQALTYWLRGNGPNSSKSSAVFISQITIATLLLWIVSRHNLPAFMPLAVIPATYLLLFHFKGEHFILTEITGFFLLALAAPLAEFTSSGRIDMTLYTAVAIFFAAGVFKVRVRLTRQNSYRVLMIVYIVLAASIYYLFALPLIALVPLADNLVFAATLYKIKLRTAGWLEVAKGALFVVLIAAVYGAH